MFSLVKILRKRLRFSYKKYITFQRILAKKGNKRTLVLKRTKPSKIRRTRDKSCNLFVQLILSSCDGIKETEHTIQVWNLKLTENHERGA